MRFTVPALAMLSCCACGGRVVDRGSEELVADAAAVDSRSVTPPDLETGPTPIVDAVPAPDDVSPEPDAVVLPPSPPAAVDCFGPDVGPSDPASFKSLSYTVQTSACSSGLCFDFFEARDGCVLWLQVKGVARTATASDADCDAFKRWSTSKRLIDALNDKVTCFGKDGPVFESTELYLVDGSSPRKKTFYCLLEPFVSHRACIAKLRAKYFP